MEVFQKGALDLVAKVALLQYEVLSGKGLKQGGTPSSPCKCDMLPSNPEYLSQPGCYSAFRPWCRIINLTPD